MSILFNGLFLSIYGYFFFKFVQVLVKMKQPILLPVDEAERMGVRVQPLKPLDSPIYNHQRTGITMHVAMFLLVFILYVTGHIFDFIGWPQYFLLLIFCLLPGSSDLLNLFAVTENGLLIGSRFIPWNRIKSFQFVPIEMNHRYYGYASEVNDAYELKIKMRLFSANCIIISPKVKQRIEKVLSDHHVEHENDGRG